MQALLAEMSDRDLTFEDGSVQAACAQLLAGFSGELEDVVNNFEAATMAAGNGVVTLTVLERARSQLAKSASSGPSIRTPSALRTPSKASIATLKSTPGYQSAEAANAAYAHPRTPTGTSRAERAPGSAGTAGNPASGASAASALTPAGSGSKTRSRIPPGSVKKALEAPPPPGTSGSGTRGDPLVFDKPAVATTASSEEAAAKFAARENAGDLVVEYRPAGGNVVTTSAPFLQGGAAATDLDGDSMLASQGGEAVAPGVEVTAGLPAWVQSATGVALGEQMEDTALPRSARYMHCSLDAMADALEARLLSFEEALLAAHDLPEPTPVGVTSQQEALVVGRILTESEAGTGRINARSVLLEGSRATSNGHRVRLDLSRLPAYTFFPGQVVACEGIATSDTSFAVSRVHTEAPLPTPHSSADMLQRDAEVAASAAAGAVTGVGSGGRGGGPLRVWSASGPFTLNSDLEYSPLQDFLAEVREADTVPDAVVLMGPFVSADHPSISAGAVTVRNAQGGEFSLTFRDLWELKICPLLAKALDTPATKGVRVVLVPSASDMLCHSVVPTPAYTAAAGETQGKLPSGVELGSYDLAPLPASLRARTTCVSSPGMFTIGDGGERVVFGAMSADVLFHLNVADASRMAAAPANKSARWATLAGQLTGQRSWYPLYPPAEGCPVDLAWAQHLDMPVTPDVMLLPSRLPPFVTAQQEGALCVGMGHLSKFNVAGTYSVMEVYPRSAEHAQGTKHGNTAEGAPMQVGPHRVAERSVVRVMRV